jgi:hypothetical protein
MIANRLCCRETRVQYLFCQFRCHAQSYNSTKKAAE